MAAELTEVKRQLAALGGGTVTPGGPEAEAARPAAGELKRMDEEIAYFKESQRREMACHEPILADLRVQREALRRQLVDAKPLDWRRRDNDARVAKQWKRIASSEAMCSELDLGLQEFLARVGSAKLPVEEANVQMLELEAE